MVKKLRTSSLNYFLDVPIKKIVQFYSRVRVGFLSGVLVLTELTLFNLILSMVTLTELTLTELVLTELTLSSLTLSDVTLTELTLTEHFIL